MDGTIITLFEPGGRSGKIIKLAYGWEIPRRKKITGAVGLSYSLTRTTRGK